MPTPYLAAIVTAVITALTCFALTPLILAWLPAPPEAPQVAFHRLATMRFRWVAAGIITVAGSLMLSLITPTLWPVWLPLIGLGTFLGLIDAETTFLPLRLSYLTLTLVSVGVLISAGWRQDLQAIAWAVGGAALAGGVFWLLWRFSGEKFGFGDVRLAAILGMAGGATSPQTLYLIFLMGTIFGALWAIVVRLQGRQQFAYGPALLLGAPAALIFTALAG